jgi:glycosidase
LNFYKKILAFRKQDPILCYGDFGAMATPKPIMAYFRSYGGHIEFVLLNLTGKKQKLPSSIKEMRGEVLLSNYVGAGFTFKKFLRPFEALIAKIK